jgi:hypothetical protein
MIDNFDEEYKDRKIEVEIIKDIRFYLINRFGVILPFSEVKKIIRLQGKYIANEMANERDIHIVGFGQFKFNLRRKAAVIERKRLYDLGLTKDEVDAELRSWSSKRLSDDKRNKSTSNKTFSVNILNIRHGK